MGQFLYFLMIYVSCVIHVHMHILLKYNHMSLKRDIWLLFFTGLTFVHCVPPYVAVYCKIFENTGVF